MISVRIVGDSVNPAGSRLTSWLLTFPRFILPEFATHRVFSKNAASSRAIPYNKTVHGVIADTAWPERWGIEQVGMQSGEPVSPHAEESIKSTLHQLMMRAVDDTAQIKQDTSLHKSILNRYLEPWMHITVLATATDHRNFFALRAHPAAMPEFQVLAYRMLDAYLKSEPQRMDWGQWHIPKFDGCSEEISYDVERELKIATARCARLSYLTFDGNHDPAADIELHTRLLSSGHMSPFEHCAQATEEFGASDVSNFDQAGNWSRWKQYRKLFPDENRTNVDLNEILNTKPSWIQLS